MKLRASDSQPTDQTDIHNTESAGEQKKSTEAASQTPQNPLAGELSRINPTTDQRKNLEILAELPRGKDGKPLPPEKLNFEDYELAFMRAAFKDAGLSNVTDSEIKAFQQEYEAYAKDHIGLRCSLSELKAAGTEDGKLRVYVSSYDQAVFSAGKKEISQRREKEEAIATQAREKVHQYFEDAIVGFYKLQINAVINTVNDATKVLHAPALPKFEIKGDYWKDKKEAVEEGLSTAVGFAEGGLGAVGKVKGVLTTAGQGVELITGKDARTGKPLSQYQKSKDALGVATGVVSTRGSVNRVMGSAEKVVKKAADSLKNKE
jgi:hypothetical protein